MKFEITKLNVILNPNISTKFKTNYSDKIPKNE